MPEVSVVCVLQERIGGSGRGCARRPEAGAGGTAADLRQGAGQVQCRHPAPPRPAPISPPPPNSRLFVTCYMGTVNSSAETRGRALRLAEQVGSHHLSIDIDEAISAHTAIFAQVGAGLCSGEGGAVLGWGLYLGVGGGGGLYSGGGGWVGGGGCAQGGGDDGHIWWLLQRIHVIAGPLLGYRHDAKVQSSWRNIGRKPCTAECSGGLTPPLTPLTPLTPHTPLSSHPSLLTPLTPLISFTSSSHLTPLSPLTPHTPHSSHPSYPSPHPSSPGPLISLSPHPLSPLTPHTPHSSHPHSV